MSICKTCGNTKCRDKQPPNEVTVFCCGGYVKLPTNADCIRAMTDEEMVAWAHKQIGCGFDYFPCGVVCDGKCKAYSTEACNAKILEWLQQPAEEVSQ